LISSEGIEKIAYGLGRTPKLRRSNKEKKWQKKLDLLALLISSWIGVLSEQDFFPKKDLMSVGVYYYPEQW